MKLSVHSYTKVLLLSLFFLLTQFTTASEQSSMGHSHQRMSLDKTGMVMNANYNNLPRDCQKISRDYHFNVLASTSYAIDIPGNIYGLSQYEHIVEPCSRITITFINKDSIRHQWMLHGLPKYLYPAGMFHLEAAGGHQRTATFIVPSDNKTYLVHCDIAQHMEKGMKAQFIVGSGNGNLWGVPTISNNFFSDTYLPQHSFWIFIVSVIVSLIATTAFVLVKR